MTVTSDELDGLIKVAVKKSFVKKGFTLSPRSLIQGPRTSLKRARVEGSTTEKAVHYDASALLKVLYNLKLNGAEVWQTFCPKKISIPLLTGY